jgi:hypothetical protein
MSAIHVPKLMHMDADLAEGRKKFGAQSVSFNPLEVPSNTTRNVRVTLWDGKEVDCVCHVSGFEVVAFHHQVQLCPHKRLLTRGQTGRLLSFLVWKSGGHKDLDAVASGSDLLSAVPTPKEKA